MATTVVAEDSPLTVSLPSGAVATVIGEGNHPSRTAEPHPRFVRGRCPECGAALVSNMVEVPPSGFLIVWSCWDSLKASGGCEYRRVL